MFSNISNMIVTYVPYAIYSISICILNEFIWAHNFGSTSSKDLFDLDGSGSNNSNLNGSKSDLKLT